MGDSSSACKTCGDRSGLCACPYPDGTPKPGTLAAFARSPTPTHAPIAGTALTTSYGSNGTLVAVSGWSQGSRVAGWNEASADVLARLRSLEAKLRCLDPVEAVGCGFTFAETMSLKWAELASAEEKAGRRK